MEVMEHRPVEHGQQLDTYPEDPRQSETDGTFGDYRLLAADFNDRWTRQMR